MQPDWDKGLPTEVLGLLARCFPNAMEAMREVSKTWKEGFEGSVSRITVYPITLLDRAPGQFPPQDGSFAARFPMLSRIRLGKWPLVDEDLRCLQGLRALAHLSLKSEVRNT